MSITEFRLFFESLPDERAVVLGKDRPAKPTFAQECNIRLAHLKEMAIGKRSFTKAMAARILPIMRKYGFNGQ